MRAVSLAAIALPVDEDPVLGERAEAARLAAEREHDPVHVTPGGPERMPSCERCAEIAACRAQLRRTARLLDMCERAVNQATNVRKHGARRDSITGALVAHLRAYPGCTVDELVREVAPQRSRRSVLGSLEGPRAREEVYARWEAGVMVFYAAGSLDHEESKAIQRIVTKGAKRENTQGTHIGGESCQ